MTTMTMTKTTTTASKPADPAGIISIVCPSGRMKARIHVESVYRGAEILCGECAGILRITQTDPLELVPVDEEDDS